MLAGMLAQASPSLRSSLAAQLRMVLTSKAKKTPTLCAPASAEPSLQAQCTAPSQVPAPLRYILQRLCIAQHGVLCP